MYACRPCIVWQHVIKSTAWARVVLGSNAHCPALSCNRDYRSTALFTFLHKLRHRIFSPAFATSSLSSVLWQASGAWPLGTAAHLQAERHVGQYANANQAANHGCNCARILTAALVLRGGAVGRGPVRVMRNKPGSYGDNQLGNALMRGPARTPCQ